MSVGFAFLVELEGEDQADRLFLCRDGSGHTWWSTDPLNAARSASQFLAKQLGRTLGLTAVQIGYWSFASGEGWAVNAVRLTPDSQKQDPLPAREVLAHSMLD